MNSIRSAINKLVDGSDLPKNSAESVMRQIMSGNATSAQIGSFLTALRMKGETPEEIAACARVMRQFASTINPSVGDTLVDTCGTGGDRINTFNVSTSAMFVVAGAGVPVAKHGNRSVTSKSGSADVLEELGVNIENSPKEVENSIEEIGLGFMFAPNFHGAMKHAIGPRKEIELRTVFNVLGPLTNPASARAQVMGVYDSYLTEKLAKVLGKLQAKNAMVVHGLDGLDEISTLGKTKISEFDEGEIRNYTVEPEDFDLPRADPKDIDGGDAEQNAKILIRILKGQQGPRRDITLLNAAAAIKVAGKADDLKKGLELAEESIESGRAYEKFESLVRITNGDLERVKQLEALI